LPPWLRRLNLTVGAKSTARRKERFMFALLSSLALNTLLLLPIADAVPKLNYEPLCREATKANEGLGDGLDARFSRCMAEEQKARATLEKEWTKFNVSSRSSCAGMSSTMGIQSYVELLTCLEMQRDAAEMEKKEKDAAK
jgi:hypothetical protein